jgi:peptidoglycan/LPS O-acetylase OafA/YrhL
MSTVQENVGIAIGKVRYTNLPVAQVQPGKNKHRSKVVDALRGIAILLVLGRHTDVSELWNKVGWCGVDLFFVLSGFLISGLLFHEFQSSGDLQLKRFWVRRGFKIYPAFYLMTAVQTFVYILRFGNSSGGPSPLRLFWNDATFVSNYIRSISGHSWSIAVEEHFYFLLPIFLLLLLKLHRRKTDPFTAIPFVFVSIAIACLWLRLAGRPESPTNYYRHVFPTHLRMDGLFCGVTIGYLHCFRPQFLQRMARWPLLLAGGMLLTPLYYMNLDYWHMYTWGLTCTYLGFACVMIWAIHVPYRKGHVLTWPVEVLAKVGFYSYSIYLWHWLIIFYLRPFVRDQCLATGRPFAWSHALETWQWPVCVALCIVVGTAMAIIVEQPFLRMRDRWFPSQARAI